MGSTGSHRFQAALGCYCHQNTQLYSAFFKSLLSSGIKSISQLRSQAKNFSSSGLCFRKILCFRVISQSGTFAQLKTAREKSPLAVLPLCSPPCHRSMLHHHSKSEYCSHESRNQKVFWSSYFVSLTAKCGTGHFSLSSLLRCCMNLMFFKLSSCTEYFDLKGQQ